MEYDERSTVRHTHHGPVGMSTARPHRSRRASSTSCWQYLGRVIQQIERDPGALLQTGVDLRPGMEHSFTICSRIDRYGRDSRPFLEHTYP
ncbi:hypothetical protein VR44_13740 [Streptomyces katrae]|uniref:Uncharacterized protein n=1 Tax=Streptomyces katrae TaxID=68223 RepID=A0A0F4JIF9_9ACTN|nr:hypothetical protein VR44_13740 [Streptomyces katrae]